MDEQKEWASITVERVGVKIKLSAFTTPPDPAKPQDSPVQPLWTIVITQGSVAFPKEIIVRFASSLRRVF